MGLQYNNITVEGKTKISPSAFVESMISPATWYKSQILKENKFAGNTASVLGTMIHNRIERHYEGLAPDVEEEALYLSDMDDNSDIDQWFIQDNLDISFNAWKEQYSYDYPKPSETEAVLKYEPEGSDFYVAGSCDAITISCSDNMATREDKDKLKEILNDISLQ